MTTPWNRVCRQLIKARFARALGLLFFLMGVATYRSFEHRDVLGIWSYPYAGIVAVVSGLVVAAIGSCVQRSLREDIAAVSLSTALTDLSVLQWGAGYWASTFENPTNGGRIADLNLLGSAVPVAVILEWSALMQLVIAGAIALWSNQERKWVNAAIVGWSLVLILVLIEGGVRVVRCVAPVVQGFPTYSSELWSRDYVRLNPAGFRDGEHQSSPERPAHRLLVVGDSYAFGWGIRRVEDRFSEVLAEKLRERTGILWESINYSRPDTHTLDHLNFLRSGLFYKPDLVMLLYVFNDVEYLSSVTPREGVSEGPTHWWERLQPLRVLFNNSFLFQEVYVRARLASYRFVRENDGGYDPYRDGSLIERHLEDVTKFVSLAADAGASVIVIPFDIAIAVDTQQRSRYQDFVERLTKAGVPTLSIMDAFSGYAYERLTVNVLDGHPNELANRLAAEAVDQRLARGFDGRLLQGSDGAPNSKKADSFAKS